MNTVSCLPTFVNIAQIQSMFHVFWWYCNVFWWYCMDFWWFLMIFWGISSKIIKSHQHRTKIWKTKKFRPEKKWFIFTRTRQRLAKKHSERSPLQIWSFQKQSGKSQKWWIMGRMSTGSLHLQIPTHYCTVIYRYYVAQQAYSPGVYDPPFHNY